MNVNSTNLFGEIQKSKHIVIDLWICIDCGAEYEPSLNTQCPSCFSSNTKSKLNISVITNFGCQTDCWYCIWKVHRLKDVALETDWEKLEKFLTQYKNKGKVSVSGGGDCLYRYDEYEDWWNKFFNICGQLDMLVDVHSRQVFHNDDFWRKVNRVVVSSDFLVEDLEYFRYLSELTKMRIVHVVTEFSTINGVQEYLDFQKESGCQFTIKPLSNYDDKGMFKKVRETFPDIYFLEEGDYNIYFMPDNTVTDCFM